MLKCMSCYVRVLYSERIICLEILPVVTCTKFNRNIMGIICLIMWIFLRVLYMQAELSLEDKTVWIVFAVEEARSLWSIFENNSKIFEMTSTGNYTASPKIGGNNKSSGKTAVWYNMELELWNNFTVLKKWQWNMTVSFMILRVYLHIEYFNRLAQRFVGWPWTETLSLIIWNSEVFQALLNMVSFLK